MRASTASLALLVALIGPTIAAAPSPRVAHKVARKKVTRPSNAAGTPADLLPVPGPNPPVPDVDRGALGADRSLHFGDVTVTPGGFLDVRTGSAAGRD